MSEKQKLKRKAELLWRLVTTTAGVADLTEPIKRVEHYFDRLTRRQQTTVAVIALQLDRGFHEIDQEEDKAEATQAPEIKQAAQAEVITPDAILPPNQEEN